MKKLLAQTLQSWWNDDSFTKSASVAYYSIFSLPGLLIIIMGMAAVFFSRESIEQEVMGHIKNVLGYEVAYNFTSIINETQRKSRDIWALVVGSIALLFGASGVFVQLQKSLKRS